MTVCAVPSSSMHRHDGARCGMESGPLNLSYTPTVRNSSDSPRGTSSCGRKNPNLSPPVSIDSAKATETSVPSPVWSVVISAAVKLFGAELPSR